MAERLAGLDERFKVWKDPELSCGGDTQLSELIAHRIRDYLTWMRKGLEQIINVYLSVLHCGAN